LRELKGSLRTLLESAFRRPGAGQEFVCVGAASCIQKKKTERPKRYGNPGRILPPNMRSFGYKVAQDKEPQRTHLLSEMEAYGQAKMSEQPSDLCMARGMMAVRGGGEGRNKMRATRVTAHIEVAAN